MDYIERNYHIIEQRMIEQMEHSIELGRQLIDTELDTGLLNFIVKPIVKTFYDYWAKNDARSGTLKQIKITLDSGKELLLNGNLEQNLEKIVVKSFPKYFEVDQTSRQCSKTHKNFERLKQVSKDTFTNYLREVIALLNVKDNIDNYGDLCRTAFKSKEVAQKNLMKQLEYTDKGIKIIEEDHSLLNIPLGRRIIVNALRKGFEQTKKEFIEALNDTYNQK
ncbi:MAG: hypothetical protein ACFE8L_06895 [Candidatus Hodarchaeota archaeon]